MGSLQQLAAEVIESAERAPDTAPEAYAEAAEKFYAFAARQENPRARVVLGTYAEDFAARSRAHFQRRATTDDFVEQERDLAQAHHEVGRFDDLEIKARRNQLAAWRDAMRGQPTVRVVPSSVVEGTRIGNQISVKFAPTDADRLNQITQEGTTLFWPGRKTESQSFTIDFDVLGINPLGVGFSARPYARVQIGADGSQGSNLIICDVSPGTRLTGAGNYVSVSIGADAPRTGTTSSVILVSAGLGFYAAPSLAPVTRTVYIDDLAIALPTGQLAVPPKAKLLLPVASTNLTIGDTYQIDFFDLGGVRVSSRVFTNSVSVVAERSTTIPVPPDAATFVITNTGSIVTSFRAMFQLAL